MAQESIGKQAVVERLRQAKNLLIVPHARPDGDALGAALGLGTALKALGKTVTIAAGGDERVKFKFVPGYDQVQWNFVVPRELLVIIDETHAKVSNVALKRLGEHKLAAVISTSGGALTKENVLIEDGSGPYDLIVLIDCADVNLAGSVYTENRQMFTETPLIIIDHHADSRRSTNVAHFIDTTASATAEMMVSVLEALGRDTSLLTADVATQLLLGIMTDTNSFKNANTTSKTLTVAAQLVGLGAKQQEITKHIFQTKSISLLRLWGRALSYIKEDANRKFVWSVLTRADFVAAQASSNESGGVIDELLKSAEGMDFVVMLTERDGGIEGSLRSATPGYSVVEYAKLFGGGGPIPAAGFRIENAQLAGKELKTGKKIAEPFEAQNGIKPSSQSEAAPLITPAIATPAVEPPATATPPVDAASQA